MTAKTLMVLGTHSNAGKSIVVTALCRIFARAGYRVAPFKAQNMALNAGVTPQGHEIGRATIAQAQAAGVTPHVDMNPVLLKPEGHGKSQVVLNGRAYTHIHADNWYSLKPLLWKQITAALDRLRDRFDLVIIEGAGSPAEINLKDGDIVNIRVAQYANAPTLLVGDIDRGGVFAALVGTLTLLEPEERDLIKAFVINKFRGDVSLLGNGLEMLQARAFNTPTLGVIPYLPHIGVAAEDSVALDEVQRGKNRTTSLVDIAVIRLPRISNFDDFDPLIAEPGVQVRFVELADDLGTPNAVILPGSKMTLADLAWLRESDMAGKIINLAKEGTPVVGICGGYQILGQSLFDPNGIEAAPGTRAAGLGLLPVDTIFAGDKRTVQVQATLLVQDGPLAMIKGTPIHGYEIHIGRSEFSGANISALCHINEAGGGHADGVLTAGGKCWGTYLHGIFDNDTLRHTWLASLGRQNDAGRHLFDRQAAYNRLADHVQAHLDMNFLQKIIETGITPNEQIQTEITPTSTHSSTAAPLSPPANAKAIREAVKKANKKKGLVMVNTGDGKGKTTAALGVMTRAWGRKMRVGVLQFIKNENARYGEIKAAEQMGNIDWASSGDGFTWSSQDLDETHARARHGWDMAKTWITGGKYNLVILDEFTYALAYGWLDTGNVIDWFKANKPEMLHLIITGRNAPASLVEYADLVTEMRQIKHPYKEQGIRAQVGIEY